ncbi:MAG: magnesium-translocating P-type ATPase [Deltaproteobacteria bacterium]|nr:magnesium-translocating P-type ATPase [Deltaproteobacteria bacterium]
MSKTAPRRAGPDHWWATPTDALLTDLGTSPSGLTSAEAAKRLASFGPNSLTAQRPLTPWSVLWTQIKSPLLLLLVFAATTSAVSGEWVDAAIILTILTASVAIGFSREYRAQTAAQALLARVTTRAKVNRDGQEALVPAAELVPGDVVLLSAGALVPADLRLLEATDLYVNEAVLTGESFPVDKHPGVVPVDTPLARRVNAAFLGSNVRGGSARAVVVATGPATRFGDIAHRLALRPPETSFERGVRRFGHLLTIAMLVMVILVFTVNTLFGRPPIETLLFSIALAVGLSPELLPVILSINLARGAQMMAKHGVLVKRLAAIQNLGSMDVLCTDKTGTLTEGVVKMDGAFDPDGHPSDAVFALAATNAALQAGLTNPLDAAIVAARAFVVPPALHKLDEVPYDFVRKRLSVIVDDAPGAPPQLITKGAFEHVLECCTTLGTAPLDDAARTRLRARVDAWSREGTRVLAVASRPVPPQPTYTRADEQGLRFDGFLTFLDQPKAGVAEALTALAKLGVAVKLITGDTRLVAEHVARGVGMPTDHVLTGKDLDELHDDALPRAAELATLFVEVDPNQKERIILALKKGGHVTGFLGDGINDAPAMHSADTSLSVESAVDVAKEAADFVLLEQDLDVIRMGIEEGRRTYANTLKYVLTTTSANLGNMVSMAIASLFLPFLPLTAGQVLLNNFLSDIPAIGIAGDAVDPELVARPRRWDMGFIVRFMVQFGLVSSLFDLLTFGALMTLFHTSAETFRTGWFIESLLTELVIALVVRTRRPFFKSRPGRVLLWSTVALATVTLVLPYLPGVSVFGFVPLPPAILATIVGITALYVLATETLKARFYRHAQP